MGKCSLADLSAFNASVAISTNILANLSAGLKIGTATFNPDVVPNLFAFKSKILGVNGAARAATRSA